MHTKTHEYRTARRIYVARVPGWILTTRHSLNLDPALVRTCKKKSVRQRGDFYTQFYENPNFLKRKVRCYGITRLTKISPTSNKH